MHLVFLAVGALPHAFAGITPVLVTCGFWCWARLMRHRRHCRATELMAEAANRFSRGDDLAAAEINRRVLALDPSCAQALILRGMIRMQSFRFREAVRDFDRALVLQPKSTLAIYRRGVAKHCLGDLDGAIEDYDRVMALEPGCADAFLGIPRSKPGARRGAADASTSGRPS